ncbi:GNAT family N-acetyltransferase [Flindersiella endophytica]
MKFTIRQAGLDDVDRVVGFAIAHLGGDLATWITRFDPDIHEPRRCLLIAESSSGEDGSGVIAYGRVSYFERPLDSPPSVAPAGYYLGGVLVDPLARRFGVGRALTVARMEWVRERADELWYFANARNEASLEMHQELGFEEVSRSFTFPGVTFEGGEGVLAVVRFR